MRKVWLWLFLFIGHDACAHPAITDTVLMVPPTGFRYNVETAKSNIYQHEQPRAHAQVMREFWSMVAKLRQHHIHVLLLSQPHNLPDAVFPNNWFSTHVGSSGKTTLFLYPMLSNNRQAEVNERQLTHVLQDHGMKMDRVIDLRQGTHAVLEGTGSMILDRTHHVLYAGLSPRTEVQLVEHVSQVLKYTPIIFHTTDQQGHAIYHTNVMMGLAQHYAVICLDCIADPKERAQVIAQLQSTHKKIIDITQEQVQHMCGNVLELQNKEHQSFLVMSRQAYQHFTPTQRQTMSHFSTLLPMPLDTIENIGGGSARCMLAEIYHAGIPY